MTARTAAAAAFLLILLVSGPLDVLASPAAGASAGWSYDGRAFQDETGSFVVPAAPAFNTLAPTDLLVVADGDDLTLDQRKLMVGLGTPSPPAPPETDDPRPDLLDLLLNVIETLPILDAAPHEIAPTSGSASVERVAPTREEAVKGDTLGTSVLPAVPFAPLPIPPYLPSLDYGVCWETLGPSACVSAVFAVPTTVDFNGDGVPDLIVTATKCVDACLDVTFQRSPAGSTAPARVSIHHDANPDPSRDAWLLAGYDSRGPEGRLLESFRSKVTFTAATSHWTTHSEVTLASGSPNLTYFSGWENRNSGVRVESQSQNVTWTKPVPTTTTLRVEVDTSAGSRTTIEHSASAPAALRLDYSKTTASKTRVEERALSAGSLPATWTGTASTDAGGNFSLAWSGDSVADRASYAHTSRESGQVLGAIDAQLATVARSLTIERSACRARVDADSATDVDFRAGVGGLPPVKPAGTVSSSSGGAADAFVAHLVRVKAFEGALECQPGRSSATASWTLATAPDSLSVAMQSGQSVARLYANNTGGVGAPARANVEWINRDDLQGLRLTGASGAFGSFDACHTPVGVCQGLAIPHDQVSVFRTASSKSVLAQARSLSALDATRGTGAFQLTAAFASGGRALTAFHQAGDDWSKLEIDAVPTSLRASIGPGGVFGLGTDATLGKATHTAQHGAESARFEASDVPAGTQADLTLGSRTLALVSTQALPVAIACVSATGSCAYGTDGTYVAFGEQSRVAHLLDVGGASISFQDGVLSGEVSASVPRGLRLRYLANGDDVDVSACMVQGRLAVGFSGLGETKTFSYDGFGWSPVCYTGVAKRAGQLRFDVDLPSEAPAALTATWDMSAAGRRAELWASSPAGTLDVRARRDDTAWRTHTTCFTGAAGLVFTWGADGASFSLESTAGSIGSLRAVLADDASGTACAQDLQRDYAEYRASSAGGGRLTTMLSGVTRASATLTPELSAISVDRTQPGHVYAYWLRGADSAALDAPIAPASVALSTDNRNWSAWISPEQGGDFVVTTRVGAYEHHTRVVDAPGEIAVRYLPEARAFSIGASGKATEALSLSASTVSGLPSFVRIKAVSVQTLDLTWTPGGANGTLVLPPGTSVGSVEATVDFSNGGSSLPRNGIRVFDAGLKRYLTLALGCTRGAAWGTGASILDVTLQPCGSDGSVPFVAERIGLNGFRPVLTIPTLPRGTIRVHSDLATYANVTSAERVANVGVQLASGGSAFHVELGNALRAEARLRPESADVWWDVSGGVGSIHAYFESAAAGGVHGLGPRYVSVDGDVVASSGAIPVRLSGGEWSVDFGGASVGRLAVWSSVGGCFATIAARDSVTSVPRCGGADLSVELRGVKRARYAEAGSVRSLELASAGGRHLHVGRLAAGDAATLAEVSPTPTSLSVEVDLAGRVLWSGSSAATVRATSTEATGALAAVELDLSASTSGDARWTLGGTGALSLDARGGVARLCARGSDPATSEAVQACAQGSAPVAHASWNLTNPGDASLDTNGTWLDGWIDVRSGDAASPSGAFLASGAILADGFAPAWSLPASPPVAAEGSAQIGATGWTCVRIPSGVSPPWHCLRPPT